MLYICLLGTFTLIFISLSIRSGQFNFIMTTAVVGFWFYFAYVMTEANVGAETLEFDEGVSLRQDSQTQTCVAWVLQT